MDMIVTYKIIQGLGHVPCRELFVFNLGSTRSNCEYAKTNTRLHDFKSRVINDWNSLPPYIVNASDMNTFKECSSTIHSQCFEHDCIQDIP